MFKPIGKMLGVLAMFVSAWLGYRFGSGIGAVLRFFVGGLAMSLIMVIAFPYLLRDEMLRLKYGTDSSSLVRSCSVIVLIGAIAFIFLTPKVMRGSYLGYSDLFTPWAIGFGSLLAIVRLRQRHPYSEVHSGEKLFGVPIGTLWILSVFSVLLWYSEPVSLATSEI